MRAYKKVFCSIAILFCISTSGFGQRYMGVATGSYNALNSLYLNPANISGAKEKIAVNIFSLNVGVDNSFGTFSKIGDLGKENTSAFTFNSNKPFSMLIPALELRLPGVLVSLNDKHKQSFALSTRVRAINQFNNFDPSLYNSITSTDQSSNQNYNLHSTDFNWTAHVWSEIGLTYAIQVFEQGPHRLKAGITLRYLGGINYLSLKGKNLDAKYTSGNDTLYATNSDLQFASNALGSNDLKTSGVNSSGILSSLFGAKSGGGFGMDIGVTYSYVFGSTDGFETKDDNKDETHVLTVSAAVTDIGSIKYKAGKNFFVDVTGNGYLTGKDLSDNLDNYTKFRNYMVNQGFTADTGSKDTKLTMPTAMVIGADFQIYKQFFVNATYIGNLANRLNYGNSYYNQLTITPRYDTRLFTVALPVTYSNLAKDVKMGLGFRISGFYFGSDDMLALISSNQHGFGIYLGGYIPIYKKKHKDILK